LVITLAREVVQESCVLCIINTGVLHTTSRAKYAVAFFSISHFLSALRFQHVTGIDPFVPV